ncbi:hypothetical protein JCM16814_34600 [Desulfobaculum senezii]
MPDMRPARRLMFDLQRLIHLAQGVLVPPTGCAMYLGIDGFFSIRSKNDAQLQEQAKRLDTFIKRAFKLGKTRQHAKALEVFH